MKSKSYLLICIVCYFASAVNAQEHHSDLAAISGGESAELQSEEQATKSVRLSNVWARATAPGMPMGAIYADIENVGKSPVTLVSLNTTIARLAEIHESVEIDGMMRMREITPFEIDPGRRVSLEPGAKHIMLMGLKKALREGERIPLSLEFSDGSTVHTQALVGGYGQMNMPNDK